MSDDYCPICDGCQDEMELHRPGSPTCARHDEPACPCGYLLRSCPDCSGRQRKSVFQLKPGEAKPITGGRGVLLGDD